MESELIQYVRKTTRKTAKRGYITRGKKRGVLLATLHPENENRIIIGFSMCHPNDRFNYVDGLPIDDWGKEMAYNRGVKIADSTGDIKVPVTVQCLLPKFLRRCKNYYKDKNFPAWTSNPENWIDPEATWVEKEEGDL
jgi:hypothetical protein